MAKTKFNGSNFGYWFKSAMSVLLKAYAIGFVQSAISILFLIIVIPSSLAIILELYWSRIVLSGFWSVFGFLCAPYAIYQTLAFLPEQAGLNGAAHCLQANSIYLFALDDRLSVVNPLLAGAIYAIVVAVFVAWRLKKRVSWASAIHSWRTFFAALTIALGAIWLKDSLAQVIGVDNFYCG
jgi:hypothetical protein